VLRALGLADLTGVGTDEGDRLPGVINEALLTGLVGLAQGALLQGLPLCVALAELGIAVAAVRVLPGVFLPQQLLGVALALERLVQGGPVRYLIAGETRVSAPGQIRRARRLSSTSSGGRGQLRPSSSARASSFWMTSSIRCS
jgi:hypothetical protein